MKTQKHVINIKWPIPLIFLCLIVSGGLGARFLTTRAQTLSPASSLTIDDFSKPKGSTSNLTWITAFGDDYKTTDGRFVQDTGRSCLYIKETVARGKSLEIIGTKAVHSNNSDISIAGQDGIYLRAKGSPGQVALGIWIESEQNGRRLYQAPVELINRWQEFRLPLRVFRAMPAGIATNDRELFRIATIPNLRQRTVEVFLDEIGFYKEQQMYNKLTREQERIIVHKGTERPFSGKYNDHYEEGIYTCARCGAALYESSSKFKSGCGWPSFDDQIEGAVKWQRDADGVRTEILCNNCGGHLGHVFLGEQMTPKNTRHCVNSLSMNFIPAAELEEKEQQEKAKAIFASGCFWGTEYYFNKAPGVISTTVGYTGGHVPNPTYKQVCTDRTGHAEAVEVEYDPEVISYEQLAKLFFETHDFTQLNRQGPDIGTQYRSAIFYLDDEQKKIATQLNQTLKKKGYNVKTEITKADTFWPAEEYHQDYYDKIRKTPYCHVYRKIF
jgi:peptide methionine sulfoxide reductase msrA/msrB